MIDGREAVRTAKTFLGTAYEKMDCNMLIIRTIREAKNGNPNYRCANTNWLWNSFESRSKYRYITTREKISDNCNNCKIGQFLLSYKEKSRDCHHIGLYIGDGKVIHSPHSGAVVRIDEVKKTSFNYVATSKYITPVEEVPFSESFKPVETPDNSQNWESGFNAVVDVLKRYKAVSSMLECIVIENTLNVLTYFKLKIKEWSESID